MDSDFGLWLMRHLEHENLNITGLAVKLGLSHAAVSDWKRGVTEPKPENIRKLARVLHLDVAEIYQALGRLSQGTDNLSESKRRLIRKVVDLQAERDLAICEATVDQMLEHQERAQGLLHSASQDEESSQ